jgi:hypothetical protein
MGDEGLARRKNTPVTARTDRLRALQALETLRYPWPLFLIDASLPPLDEEDTLPVRAPIAPSDDCGLL